MFEELNASGRYTPRNTGNTVAHGRVSFTTGYPLRLSFKKVSCGIREVRKVFNCEPIY